MRPSQVAFRSLMSEGVWAVGVRLRLKAVLRFADVNGSNAPQSCE